ncbi:MAG: hypothetical protein HC828_05590 [Blastochloris sp.]|nr:hypothetical protein [Blastochloris sp.]
MVQGRETDYWVFSVERTPPPDPGPGWTEVKQLLVKSGCEGYTSTCGSDWQPRGASFDGLAEKPSAQVRLGTGQGNGNGPFNASIIYGRQQCPATGSWAAGTWHYNFWYKSWVDKTERVVQDGFLTRHYITYTQRWQSRYHQSFAHSDTCLSEYPIFPVPQITPTLEPTPTLPPGGAPDQVNVSVRVTVDGSPPTGGQAAARGGGDAAPGDRVATGVSFPSSWHEHMTWGGISHSGCEATGSGDTSVAVTAPHYDCTITYAIRFISGPQPTWTPGPTPTMPPQPCIPHTREEWPLWTPAEMGGAQPGVLVATQPTLTFAMHTLDGSKSIDQREGSDRWNQAEVKILRWDPAILDWRETSRMTWEVVGTNFRADQRQVRGGALPVPRGYHTATHDGAAQTVWSLAPLEAGQYMVTSKTSNQNCVERLGAWYFQVGGIPPAPAPPSRIALYAWVYNQQEAAYQSTRENRDPARWRWGYGGPMTFYPDADLDFDLPPALAAQGYTVESQVTGWTFRGSPDLGPTDVDLEYAEAVTASWTVVAVPEKPGEYRYVMDPTDVGLQRLDVVVQYEYQYLDPRGTPVGGVRAGEFAGTFLLGIVMAQIVSDHIPENVGGE